MKKQYPTPQSIEAMQAGQERAFYDRVNGAPTRRKQIVAAFAGHTEGLTARQITERMQTPCSYQALIQALTSATKARVVWRARKPGGTGVEYLYFPTRAARNAYVSRSMPIDAQPSTSAAKEWQAEPVALTQPAPPVDKESVTRNGTTATPAEGYRATFLARYAQINDDIGRQQRIADEAAAAVARLTEERNVVLGLLNAIAATVQRAGTPDASEATKR